MTTAQFLLTSVSAFLAIAWIPVAVYFWRSWKYRGSPLSIAICAIVVYPIFTNASTVILLFQTPEISAHILVAVNGLLLLNFVICFKWQKERFPDKRSRPIKATPNSYEELS